MSRPRPRPKLVTEVSPSAPHSTRDFLRLMAGALAEFIEAADKLIEKSPDSPEKFRLMNAIVHLRAVLA